MSDTGIRVSGKRLTNTIRGVARHRVAAAIAALVLLPCVAPYEALSGNILLFGLYAVGFNLVFGYTGMLSFGHAAFFGVGAYPWSIAVGTFNVNLLVTITLRPFVAGFVEMMTGALAIRTRGIYFAMVTLAL